MNACLAHNPKRQIFFITLLFSCITFVCNAQWTFTETVIQNGKCIPYPRAPQVPYYTQSACEAARQWELSNSGQDYSMLGDGSCTTIITCTPCIGSEINTPIQTTVPGQASAGEVSFDGQFEGKPLYSPHESSAFEDWSKDYRQQLESYGIKSILGNTLTAPTIPLTGDRDFDIFYIGQTASFNPTTSPISSPGSDPNVIDLTGKAGVVKLLRSPEQQAMFDRQYQSNLTDQGYIDLAQMDPANPEIYDGPEDNQKKKISNAAVAEFTLDAIGDVIGMAVGVLVPEAGLPSFIQSFGTNLAQATPANIQSGLNAISGTGSPNDVKDPGQLVNSSYINTCTLCKWWLTPIKY